MSESSFDNDEGYTEVHVAFTNSLFLSDDRELITVTERGNTFKRRRFVDDTKMVDLDPEAYNAWLRRNGRSPEQENSSLSPYTTRRK